MSVVLSEQLESVAKALEDSDLVVLGGVVDVEAFIDALEHAAAIAAEAEHDWSRSNIVSLGEGPDLPAYPPLVRLLARAVPEQEGPR